MADGAKAAGHADVRLGMWNPVHKETTQSLLWVVFLAMAIRASGLYMNQPTIFLMISAMAATA